MMVNEQIRQALNEVRPLPIRYTADELEFMSEDDNRYELIEGELTVSPAPHLDHQRTITNFIIAFGDYLRKNPIGEIFTTPGVIFSLQDAVIPDLVFATYEIIKKSVIGEGEQFERKFNAAPELVIDILS